MNWQLYLVLGTPLVGGILLALWGHKNWAAELNIAMSVATFIAAAALTAQIISAGPLVTANEQFFVDSLNVFLVALTAFVSMTTSLFSRPYMRIEHALGKLSDNRLRLFHSMYQLFIFTMLVVLLTNNLGI